MYNLVTVDPNCINSQVSRPVTDNFFNNFRFYPNKLQKIPPNQMISSLYQTPLFSDGAGLVFQLFFENPDER